MDKFFESIHQSALECDSNDLLIFFENAYHWAQIREEKYKKNLFDNWYRNKSIRKFLCDCYPSKHVRAYTVVSECGNVQEQRTHKLETGNVYEWSTDKNKCYEEAERLVLSGVCDKSMVGTHLIPKSDIIFDYSKLSQFREFGSSLGKGYYGQPLRHLLDQDWGSCDDKLLVSGDNNRCMVEKVFSLDVPKENLQSDVLSDIKAKLGLD